MSLRPRGVITIPAALREQLDLDTDDQLIATVEDGRIILTPAVVVPRPDLDANKVVPRDQAWFHTPGWQAKEAEAEADKAAGRLIHYDNEEDFLASLEPKTASEPKDVS